jgi:hypothetical protein
LNRRSTFSRNACVFIEITVNESPDHGSLLCFFMFPRMPSIFFVSETSKHAAFARSMRLAFTTPAAPRVLKQNGNISNPSPKAVGYVMRDHGVSAIEQTGRKHDTDAHVQLRGKVLAGVEYLCFKRMGVTLVATNAWMSGIGLNAVSFLLHYFTDPGWVRYDNATRTDGYISDVDVFTVLVTVFTLHVFSLRWMASVQNPESSTEAGVGTVRPCIFFDRASYRHLSHTAEPCSYLRGLRNQSNRLAFRSLVRSR